MIGCHADFGHIITLIQENRKDLFGIGEVGLDDKEICDRIARGLKGG